jgi:chromosome segregation ATPase
MPRPGVTREQVFEAADALLREGQTPTVVGVLTRLGTGSPNTITPLLAQWKAQSGNRPVDVLTPLPEPVESAMRQVWGAAWKAARDQLEGEREALAKAREGIEAERNQMLAEIDRLDTALEHAQEGTRKATEALEAERRAHEQTRTECREARAIGDERNRRIEDQGNELRDLRRQLAEVTAEAARLEGEAAGLRNSLTAAQAEIDRLKEVQPKLTREGDQAKADLTRLHAENQRLAHDLDGAKDTAKHAKVALDAGAKKIAKLETNLDEERQARTAAEQAAAALRVEVAALTERAARADELRQLLERLQPDKAAAGYP